MCASIMGSPATGGSDAYPEPKHRVPWRRAKHDPVARKSSSPQISQYVLLGHCSHCIDNSQIYSMVDWDEIRGRVACFVRSKPKSFSCLSVCVSASPSLRKTSLATTRIF